MVEQDYLARLINGNVRTILRMAFNSDVKNDNEIDFQDGATMQRYLGFLKMIDDGEVNEAENILLDEMDYSDMKQFQMALMFYSYLNRKDNDFLEDCNYSREEVQEGIKMVSKKFGFDSLV